MHQFRVTDTSAGKVLLADNRVRSDVVLVAEEIESDASPLLTLKSFIGTWLCANRSTEHVMRGTANEGAVLSSLSAKPFVKAVYE